MKEWYEKNKTLVWIVCIILLVLAYLRREDLKSKWVELKQWMNDNGYKL